MTRRTLVLFFALLVCCMAQLGSFSFSKAVTTAGTRVQLSTTSMTVRGFAVIAQAGNTGLIYVGGADVDSAKGNRLASGQSESWIAIASSRQEDMYDLSRVWIDSSVSGEGVVVRYVR